MSAYEFCDYCGREIDPRYAYVTLKRLGPEFRQSPQWLGDYHEKCWKKIWKAIERTESTAKGRVEHLPAATAQKIGKQRKKDTKPPHLIR